MHIQAQLARLALAASSARPVLAHGPNPNPDPHSKPNPKPNPNPNPDPDPDPNPDPDQVLLDDRGFELPGVELDTYRRC